MGSKAGTGVPATADECRLADAAVTAVANGQLGKAASLLESRGLAPATEATAERMRGLLEQHAEREEPAWDWVTRRQGSAAALTFEAFRDGVRKAKRGSATDLGGWAYEHLQMLLEDASAAQAAWRVADSLVRGCLSRDAYDWLDLSRATPLAKAAGGVRPLACAATWRRAAMGALMAQEVDTLADALGEEQYVVGKSAGLESMVRDAGAALQRPGARAALLFDCVCAFNSLFREVMLEEIEESVPHLLTAFALWLARRSRAVFVTADGQVHVFESVAGVDQGCPGSPAAFAFGMRRALRRLQRRLPAEAGARLLAYLDDLTIILDEAFAGDAVEAVTAELAELGMSVNAAKSTCYTASNAPPGGAAAQLWANAPNHEGFLLCGTPFGRDRAPGSMAEAAGLVPLGSEGFVTTFLNETAARFGSYVRRVAALPALCTPGRPGVQCANALLRLSGDAAGHTPPARRPAGAHPGVRGPHRRPPHGRVRGAQRAGEPAGGPRGLGRAAAGRGRLRLGGRRGLGGGGLPGLLVPLRCGWGPGERAAGARGRGGRGAPGPPWRRRAGGAGRVLDGAGPRGPHPRAAAPGGACAGRGGSGGAGGPRPVGAGGPGRRQRRAGRGPRGGPLPGRGRLADRAAQGSALRPGR